MNTDAVIVNWNGASFLDKLLTDLQHAGLNQIILLDNASSDSSVQIAEKHSSVKLMRNTTNIGFGAAANQGIKSCSSGYVLLLNVDIEISRESIALMEAYLEKHNDVAIVAPQLHFPDGKLQPSCRKFPTISGLFLYLSYLDRVVSSSYRLPAEKHEQVMEVDQPMGAALMIRRNVLQQLGAFDERFFLYMEEVDLCERTKRAGHKIVFLPDAKVVHHAGGSSKQDKSRAQTYYFQSVIRYFRKRFSAGHVFLLRCAISLAMPFRAIVALLRGRPGEAFHALGMMFRIFWLN